MDDPSDRDLILRARRGDAQAFGELVRRYQNTVFNVCYRLIGERREAEDMTQEAFLRAYARLGTFDPERAFSPWMRRVAANLCFNRLAALPLPGLPLDEERDERAGAFSQPGPELAYERRERAVRLRSVLAGLPPRYRVVIELRHFQALRYDEIAHTLGIPLSDVKSDLFRARRLLAEKLKHDPSF